MNTLLTNKIYDFISKQIEKDDSRQAVSESISNINVPNFHSEYIDQLVSSYFPIKCDELFLAKFIYLIVRLYQHDFMLSEDGKIVGLNSGEVESRYIDDVLHDHNFVNRKDDKEICSILTSSGLNGLEQFFIWCLYKLIKYDEHDEYEEDDSYTKFKTMYINNVTFFESECPEVTPVNFLELKVYQSFGFFNKDGINEDESSLDNTDITLSSSPHFKKDLPAKMETDLDIYLTEPTIFDILVGFLTIKSGKYDRWYELFCVIEYNTSENRFVFEFDHGS